MRPIPEELTVRCVACEGEIDLLSAFDRCTKSWPSREWIAFSCARCNGTNYISFASGWPGPQRHGPSALIAMGYLDGIPAPAFVALQQLEVSDLEISIESAGIHLRLHDKSWFIEAPYSGI